jgi:hypothetical protein
VHLSLIRQNLSQEGRVHVRFKTITSLHSTLPRKQNVHVVEEVILV